jgi:two-component system, OmpR family, response regulator
MRDSLEGTLKRNDRSIQLLPREFRLLAYMMCYRDQTLSRPMLLQEVWNHKFVPKTNIVDVYMGRLRRKVDEPQEKPMIDARGVDFILSTLT